MGFPFAAGKVGRTSVLATAVLVAGLCVCTAWAEKAGPPPPAPSPAGDYFVLRDPPTNARIRFQREKEGRVVFLGGSITNMDPGWRSLTCEDLQRRFPQTRFDFVNAGIPSTDSTLAAHRLGQDVFGRGRVDLLFVEFAVNDHHNGRSAVERIRGTEGIIRQARRRNPAIDIVMLYCAEPDKIDDYRRGVVPAEIASHERVARHYGVTSVDFAREVTARLDAGEFTWEQFGGLHPGPLGHRLYAATLRRLLDAAWAEPLAEQAAITPHPALPDPLDEHNYEHGHYLPLDQAVMVNGWRYVESWKATDGAGTRPGFQQVPALVATEPGAVLKLYFEGTGVGVLVVAGPDVGVLEASVDGGPYRPVDQFTPWSARLHIPWAYMLRTGLERGEHELTLRTTAMKNNQSRGHAARIVKFLVH